jgi:exo-beta-1,3-glucanase (GH17 family)
VNDFPTTVIGIVVGNEDMFDHLGNRVPNLQTRIVADIGSIKKEVGNSVIVTSAQRDPDWYRLNQSDPAHVLDSMQVLGDNIYPFWGNSPEKIGGVSVATGIQSTAMKLKNALAAKGVTGVIVTEEGWPSCGMNANTQDATIGAEIDYFHTWRKHENQSFDSYYFVAYDLRTTHGCPDGANTHFGLCTDTNETKDSMLCNCKGYCATPNGSG